MTEGREWERLRERIPLPYLPIGRLGKGGGAQVLRACSASIPSNEVALKVVHDLMGSEEAKDSIRKEARVLQRLRGIPGIIRFVGFEENGGDPILVIERVVGCNLGQAREQSFLTLEKALGLLARVADAVALVHQRGVVHGDLKPQNILLTRLPGGIYRPTVIDFGLAEEVNESEAHHASRLVSGSPAYMPPEAFDVRFRPGRSRDLYALGVMLFELVTGVLPFQASNISEMYFCHLHAPVPTLAQMRPGVYPERLERLVQFALEKSVRHRLTDAAIFARELREATAELGSLKRMPLPRPVSPRVTDSSLIETLVREPY